MFVRQKQIGNVLLVVLVVTSVITLFTNGVLQATLLEYRRIYNQILFQQVWQNLEFKIIDFIKILETKNTVQVDNNGEYLGFVADTLEFGCDTGIMLYKLQESTSSQNAKLIITYSIRK